MDRELRVSNNGTVHAELKFVYDRPGSGKVWIVIYRVYDLGDDMKSSYPLFEMEQYFSHGEFKTIEQIKEFDRSFLKKQPDTEEIFAASMDFNYDPITYRFVISHRDIVGVANIDFDFDKNERNMNFMSCRHMKDDYQLTSDSFQTNKAFIEHFTSEYLQLWGVNTVRVNY